MLLLARMTRLFISRSGKNFDLIHFAEVIQMIHSKKIFGIFIMIMLGIGILSHTALAAFWDKKEDKKKEETYVMTEAELQATLMGFADRFISVLSSAFVKFDSLSSSAENRYKVMSMSTYAMSSAYSIAADPYPAVALLDMAAMITLGRMVFEESLTKGELQQVEPIVEAFRSSEADIFQMTAKIFTQDQQKQLIEIISNWRQEHPEVTFFPYIRFSDFETARKDSRLAKGPEPSGLFKSVEAATRKVDEMRLLAERGIFLGTRLPMLTGLFADVWLSRLGHNPEFRNAVNQLNKLTEVSERFARVAESLPDEIAAERDRTIKQAMQNITELTMKTIDATAGKVAKEREAVIKQAMQAISAERKQTFKDFAAEEQRLRGVLTDLRLTLVEGNNLVASVNSLTKQLGLEASSGKAESKAKPVSIDDYRKTIADATQLVNQLNTLTNSVDQILQSPAWEKLQPLMDKSVDRVGAEGEQMIDHTFRQVVLLILISMVGYVVARLLYQYLSKKIA